MTMILVLGVTLFFTCIVILLSTIIFFKLMKIFQSGNVSQEIFISNPFTKIYMRICSSSKNTKSKDTHKPRISNDELANMLNKGKRFPKKK